MCKNLESYERIIEDYEGVVEEDYLEIVEEKERALKKRDRINEKARHKDRLERYFSAVESGRFSSESTIEELAEEVRKSWKI